MDDLKKRFTYHPPKEGQPVRYTEIRNKALELAELINKECPESREKSLAITNLEETVMWANAAIARNDTAIIVDSMCPGEDPEVSPDGETFRHKGTLVRARQFTGEPVYPVCYGEDGKPYVVTIHGEPAPVEVGDWIIDEAEPGCAYPCKPHIFELRYEKVNGG